MLSKYLFLISYLLYSGAAWAILPIQQWQTSSGARVYFVENRDIPMLDLSIDFAAGSGFDRSDKAGVASMTNHIMRLGAEGMDQDEIARRTADIGAGISGRFDSDRAGLSMRTLSSRSEREQALEVFTRILHKPTFPADTLNREKRAASARSRNPTSSRAPSHRAPSISLSTVRIPMACAVRVTRRRWRR
jgi:zinc protease